MSGRNRIWEIDFLRGLAIILMIIFHIVFDLKELYGYPLNYSGGFWFYVGKAAASLFIFICGISANLSSNTFKNGLIVLGWGMILTVITYLYTPALYIRFGILHLLGLSLLAYPFIRKLQSGIVLILGFIILFADLSFSKMAVTTDWLLPFGLNSTTFASLDYYPLVPWFGLFLIGTAVGKFAYASKTSLLPFQIKVGIINRLGHKSLFIYLVHQPIIYGILLALKHLQLL
ncbi:DUF1624 domain-containing protein [bacterium BFN5]|nr:DUF1624 domain-containing protein [bacterium BFN5]